MGFRASNMAAGAKAVLMSLWKVPDESATKLMTAFYQNLWEKKMPKGEALKKAQEEVRKDKKFRKPIHWASRVLVGKAW